MVVSLIVLLVLFCVVEAPSIQAQMFSVQALMAQSINSPSEVDAAVELKMDDFKTTLWATSASWAIVEFFAHWFACAPKFKEPGLLFQWTVFPNPRAYYHPETSGAFFQTYEAVDVTRLLFAPLRPCFSTNPWMPRRTRRPTIAIPTFPISRTPI